MHTFDSALALFDIAVPAHLEAQAEVPVLAGPQRQGDVGIFPADLPTANLAPIPAEGVQVVRGEATGNTHWLHGPGCSWLPAGQDGRSVALGVLHVPDGCTAWLIHTDEHGANGIAPGTYRLTGKREMAEKIRRVAD